MNEVAVMDYCTGEIYIYELPRDGMDSKYIEDWLDSMGFNLDDCYYMCNPNIIVNDERHRKEN